MIASARGNAKGRIPNHGHQENPMKARIATVAWAVVYLLSPGPSWADFPCATVVHSGQTDPDGRVLTTSFVDLVGVNAAGDVVLVGRPRASRSQLYLYPNAGPPVTIAAGSSAAPNGKFFRSASPFADFSINDSGDVAFIGRFSPPGQAVFVRVGGLLETAATSPGPSPNGGIFTQIAALSRLDAAGRVAFLATVAGAPSGVFVYDSTSDALTTALEVAAPTAGGRQVCRFEALALGDSGAIAVTASSKVDCSDAMEAPVSGIFLHDGMVTREVVLKGDASPLPGSTFSGFQAGLLVTSADEVVFRADVAGIVSVGGVFLSDLGIPATTRLLARGDPSPVGGVIGKLAGFDVADDGEIFFRSTLAGSPQRFGVFAFDDDGDEAVLVRSSAPPLDAFAAGAAFSNFSVPAVSRDGTQIALLARVRDLVAPRGKRGVLRCAP
jgi:hypothetical protein